jgi:hypothetical protein
VSIRNPKSAVGGDAGPMLEHPTGLAAALAELG